MKIPQSPPSTKVLLDEIMSNSDPKKVIKLFSSGIKPTDNDGRYLHWEKLRYLEPPKGFSPEEYWLMTKTARKQIYKSLPFLNKFGNTFQYCITDSMLRDLHWLDQKCAGTVSTDQPIINSRLKDSYLVSSLIEESINSSQLEGASTTRNVAKEMLRQGRKPKNHSEKMIFNNYQAMRFISKNKKEKLTPEIIRELHRILIADTLEDDNKAGNYRDINDDIHIVDNTGTNVLHTPPNASELPDRMSIICQFANEKNEKNFLHPVIRAIILHFMIGYDHPFVDGNGRTARALFYWSMAQQEYWLMEFISISKIIKNAPVQYADAYLHVETDDNDLTYFIIHQLTTIKRGVESLFDYLRKKSIEIEDVEKLLDSSRLRNLLNGRQLAVIKHAMKRPGAEYSIAGHCTAHNIARQTARTDLLALSDNFNLLRKFKSGNTFVFISPPDIRERLMAQ